MKKVTILLCCLTMVLGMAGAAWAIPIVFTDTTWFNAEGTTSAEDYDDHLYGTVYKIDGPLDFVAWTHHFVPPAASIISGTLRVSLRDDGDPGVELGFGWAEDGTWDLGEVNTGLYSYIINPSFLQDGHFSVVLGSIWGDFFIDRSDLEIGFNSVPEPVTMLLLSTGLLGLAAVGRKRFKKS